MYYCSIPKSTVRLVLLYSVSIFNFFSSTHFMYGILYKIPHAIMNYETNPDYCMDP